MQPANQGASAPPREPVQAPPRREPPLPYNSLALDRAAGRRGDEAWLRGVARHPGSGCGRLLFPRIEPAVIVVVEAPGAPPRCLLGRHRGAAAGAFALIAGFVDIGESLEDAVRREVAEEAGVPVGEVRYQGSQAWPYPAGIMVGFRARATSEVIAVDHDELTEARWFTRAGLAAHRAARPRTHGDSIGTHLLDAWLAEGG